MSEPRREPVRAPVLGSGPAAQPRSSATHLDSREGNSDTTPTPRGACLYIYLAAPAPRDGEWVLGWTDATAQELEDARRAGEACGFARDVYCLAETRPTDPPASVKERAA